jgi:hypothetical protein
LINQGDDVTKIISVSQHICIKHRNTDRHSSLSVHFSLAN